MAVNSGEPGLRRIDRDVNLGLARGSAVVAIPVYGAHDLFVSCLRSVLLHTPQDIPILVADDASPDPAIARFVESLAASGEVEHSMLYLRQPENVGFVENVNTAFRVASPADVVILNSDCEVGEHWLDLLREAAYSDSSIATATALTNHGTLVSVPDRNRPTPTLPRGMSVAEVAASVARASRRIRPRIPTAIGHCVYVRRTALDLVGDFDTAFSPGYGEEVDFSQRCVLRGLVHVAADDVFVYHRGGGTFEVENATQKEHELIIGQRYPYYHQQIDAAERRATGPLARALAIARTAVNGLSVTIDARCLGPTITGTQIHVLELIHALARTERVRLRVVVPTAHMSTWFRASLERLPAVELLDIEDVTAKTPKTTIVHRPYQVFDLADLDAVAHLGERFVVTHQDLISYRNPGYSRSFLDWDSFHDLTRLTLAIADYVLFFSQHAANDAMAEGLVDERRVRVAHLGVDHCAAPETPTPQRPASLPVGAEASFLLCIGTNFKHKNRVFALRLLDELLRRHEWDGHLVLAGPHASAGTSTADEAEYLALHPHVARRTVDLRGVTEGEKAWLLGEAKGVVYPTAYEGFGLVPFEAADYGTPCFFAWQTAVAELLPESAATIVQWDPAATADEVAAVLADPDRARELVDAVRRSAEPLKWERTAAQVLEVYELAARDPDRDVAHLSIGAGGPLGVATRLSHQHLDALALPPDIYRAFRALAGRPQIRPWFFRFLRGTYAVGYFLRHRRTPF